MLAPKYQILAEYGLAYVRYPDFADPNSTMRAIDNFIADPGFDLAHRHLIDLSNLRGFDGNLVGVMKVQAKKAEAISRRATETLMIYYAPNEVSQRLSHLCVRSWEGFDCVVPSIQTDERQTLEVLGINAISFAQMLARAKS